MDSKRIYNIYILNKMINYHATGNVVQYSVLVQELFSRPQHPAPKFKMNPDVRNFYDFTVDDFIVEDYQAGPQIRGIPVAV